MAKEPKLPKQGELVSVLLHQADYFAARKNAEALSEYGVTMYQAMCLVYIADHEKNAAVNQRAIERYTRLSNPGVSKLISSLADLGYLTREHDPRDARSYALKTTPEGRRAAEAFRLTAALSDRDICARLSQEEILQLVALLKKIHI